MYTQHIDTEPVKQCPACAAQLPASANFCRCCGINQAGERAMSSKPCWPRNDAIAGRGHEADQLLSSMLVRSITSSVAFKTAPLRCSRLGTRVVAALAVIPIWLLIIMLSPLDAYAAAKTASSRLNHQ